MPVWLQVVPFNGKEYYGEGYCVLETLWCNGTGDKKPSEA